MKKVCGVLGVVSMFLGMVGSAGAVSFNALDYRLVTEYPGISWADAESSANGIGSGWDLASITTAEENDFIKSLLPTINPDRVEYWIGGQMEGKDVVWVSGETSSFTESFTDWWAGEPNNVNGQEGGVAMDWRDVGRAWAWNDEGAAPLQVIGYIAEKSPVPVPGTVLLLGFGLMGLVGFGRKRMKN